MKRILEIDATVSNEIVTTRFTGNLLQTMTMTPFTMYVRSYESPYVYTSVYIIHDLGATELPPTSGPPLPSKRSLQLLP